METHGRIRSHAVRSAPAGRRGRLLLAAQGAWAQEPIRVGAFLSVTGPAAFLGDPELKTLELYVERLNAEGGVLGRKLQLVAYDDAGDAEKARTFAKRLLEQDKVDAHRRRQHHRHHDGGGAAGRSRPACPSSRWPARWSSSSR